MAKRLRCHCNNCNKPIRFVRHGEKCIPCDKKQLLIKPSINGDPYFRANGTLIVGYESDDGYAAYKPHTC